MLLRNALSAPTLTNLTPSSADHVYKTESAQPGHVNLNSNLEAK
jgi:hypothetical protein